MSNRPAGLLIGATYPFRAIALLFRTPKLWPYIIAPIIINVIVGLTVYAGLLFFGLRAIDALLTNVPLWLAEVPAEVSHLKEVAPAIALPVFSTPGWWPDWRLSLPALPALPDWHLTLPDWHLSLPDWLPRWNLTLPDWIKQIPGFGLALVVWVLRVILTVILLLVTGFIFLQFGVLLGAPWYGKLSEELERVRTGQLATIEVGLVKDIWRAIAYELKKLVLTLGIGLPLLLLNLLPGIGTAIASIGGITLTTTIVCMDFMDAAVERRRPSFRQKLGNVWGNLPDTAGFGLVCFVLVSVPLVNLLAVPVCVAAGTLFFCDRILPRRALKASKDAAQG